MTLIFFWICKPNLSITLNYETRNAQIVNILYTIFSNKYIITLYLSISYRVYISFT